MNAYELADEFKNRNWDEVDCVLWCEKSANMLRQQADRIAELEKQSEPVAWMSPDGKVSTTEGMLFHIPLYTTPLTKPAHDFNTLTLDTGEKRSLNRLSDEEIYELWCEADNTELLPEMRLKDGSINYIITTFAKLIEERHGIK